jgi:hypothetical protein
MATLPIKSGEIVISPETAQLFADTYVSGAIAAAADGMSVALPQPVVAALWLADPTFPAEMDAHCISSDLVSFLALRAIYRCNSDKINQHVYAKLLIEHYVLTHNAYIETELRNHIGATINFEYDILPQYLLYKFHDVYDASEESPLIYMLSKAYMRDDDGPDVIASGFINAGCDCSYVNGVGRTALMTAICFGYGVTAKAIIATGRFAPDQIGYGGNTALTAACMDYLIDIAMAILATGHGLPNHKNDEGKTALDLCIECAIPHEMIRVQPLIDALTAYLPK